MSLQCYLEKPAFDLLSNPWHCQRFLFEEFAELGAITNDLRADSGNGSAAERSVSLQLPTINLTVRLSLEKAQLICSPYYYFFAPQLREVSAVFQRLFGAKTKMAVFKVDAHVHLFDIEPSAFLSQWGPPEPPDLGPVQSNGVQLTFGPHNKRFLATLFMEASNVHPGSIFAQVGAGYESPYLEDLPNLVDSFIIEVKEALKLDFVAGDKAQ